MRYSFFISLFYWSLESSSIKPSPKRSHNHQKNYWPTYLTNLLWMSEIFLISKKVWNMYFVIYTNVLWHQLNAENKQLKTSNWKQATIMKKYGIAILIHIVYMWYRQFVLLFQAKNQDPRILTRRTPVLQAVNVCQVDIVNRWPKC